MVVVFDLGKKVFVMYMAYLSLKMTIHLAWKAQITLLIIKKVLILAKHFDYAKVFLKKFVAELLKYFNINKHFINLIPDK